MNQPTLRRPAEGRTVAILGHPARFLVTAEETGGAYATWESIIPPGGGTPPHIHSRENEGVFILEGEMTLRIGDETIKATAGTYVNMPVGLVHALRNEGDRTARMLVTAAPAGLEQMFLDAGIALPEGSTDCLAPTQADVERLLNSAPHYGIEMVAHEASPG